MRREILVGALAALAASAITAGAATNEPAQPSIKGVYTRQALLDHQMDRIEKQNAVLLDRSEVDHLRVGIMYRRQGGGNVQYGEPYDLIKRIYCEVSGLQVAGGC